MDSYIYYKVCKDFRFVLHQKYNYLFYCMKQNFLRDSSSCPVNFDHLPSILVKSWTTFAVRCINNYRLIFCRLISRNYLLWVGFSNHFTRKLLWVFTNTNLRCNTTTLRYKLPLYSLITCNYTDTII